MIIEHAERFGLAALHQLRGRVGRGEHQSYAFLIYSKKLTDTGIRRLKIMKEITDGFRIAEEDLKIRGPGEILGILQSGFPELIHADLSKDMEVIKNVKNDIKNILAEDKELKSDKHVQIRNLLKIKQEQRNENNRR
jgi:ATP-dependent DNA helicase RecG